MRRLFNDDVQVRHNLKITVRERGKLVKQHECHNIFLDYGRAWLANLLAYASYGSPDTFQESNRIRYMGFGIGGDHQYALTLANAPPMSTAYPGANTQTSTDPTITRLERPVRVSGTETAPPYDASDLWLGEVAAPATHPTSTRTTFTRVFSEGDLSYGSYTVVPLSEVMLFTSAANPLVPNSQGVAYHPFPVISKTVAFSIQLDWTFIIG